MPLSRGLHLAHDEWNIVSAAAAFAADGVAAPVLAPGLLLVRSVPLHLVSRLLFSDHDHTRWRYLGPRGAYELSADKSVFCTHWRAH